MRLGAIMNLLQKEKYKVIWTRVINFQIAIEKDLHRILTAHNFDKIVA